MGSLEEIYVRLRGGNRQKIMDDLWESLSGRGNINDLSGLNLYSHAKNDMDLCLHLYWTRKVPSNGSEFAMRIVAGLEVSGFVKHTVWNVEKA